MPKPSGTLLQRLGPSVSPFERLNRNNPNLQRSVAKGESTKFTTQIYDGD